VSITLAAENTTEIYGEEGVIIQNHGASYEAARTGKRVLL
jgi:hypothetical protein